MKYTKKKLPYFIFAVIAYLVTNSFFHETTPLPTAIQSDTPFSSNKPIAIQKKPPVNIAPPKVTTALYNNNEKPSQHIFDENICNLEGIRIDNQPALEEAINRLPYLYKHNYYPVNQYLEINVYAPTQSKYFNEELTLRVKALHNNYINMLGESAKRKITLNLVITKNRSDYLHFISYYSSNINTSLGVYFGGLNIAFVDSQHSDDKALQTAIHESVHAFNAHLIGKTPPMFNEGMAEYYEDMTLINGKMNIQISSKAFTKETYPLMQFFDHQQWLHLDKTHLYYSSWAWITFMQMSQERLESLIYFMKKEQNEPCSIFSGDEAYTFFRDQDSMFEINFYEWQKSQFQQVIEN